MVKLTPDKQNLEPGYTAFISIFKRMGLELNQEFENRDGEKLVVKRSSDEKWKVERAEG